MVQKTQRVTLDEAKKLLGLTAGKMSDKEIETLLNQLYSLINQIIDNNINSFKICKRH